MSLLVKNYAQAFHNFAKQKEALRLVAKDMIYLNHLSLDSEVFNTFLDSPLLKLRQLNEIIDILKKKINLSEITIKFLHFLYFQKRLNFLDKISQEFLNLDEKESQKIKVRVISAFSLSSSQSELLINLLQNKLNQKVVLQQEVMPVVKGGIMVKIGDYQLDLSLKGQLTDLAKAMRG